MDIPERFLYSSCNTHSLYPSLSQYTQYERPPKQSFLAQSTTYIPLANRTLAWMCVAICYVIVNAIALIIALSGRIIYAVTCSDTETTATGFSASRPRTPVTPRVVTAPTYEKHMLEITYFSLARLNHWLAKC